MNLAPFQSPLAALNDLRAAARGSKEKVALAWEREDGNVYRFDVPLPSRIAPKALPEVRHLVERVAKFVLWSAGGWRLRIAGPGGRILYDAAADAPRSGTFVSSDIYLPLRGGRTVYTVTVTDDTGARDVTVIRVIMLVAIFAASAGFWAYIVLWIVVPKAITPAQQCEMRGLVPSAENMAKFATWR